MEFKTFQSKKEISNIDGLRGISIAFVMLHHIPYLTNPILKNLQENGRLGVMLFFVISGFLITNLAIREKNATGAFNLKNFYIRRSLRIFPLYYFVLAIVCFLVFIVHVYPEDVKNEFSQKLPSYLFYYSNLTGPIEGPFSLLWSLAVEEQFYFFFSFLFFLLPFSMSRILFFTLTVLRLSMPLWDSFFYENVFLVAFRYQEAILLGVSLAYLLNIKGGYDLFNDLFVNDISLFFVFSSLIGIFLFFSVEKSPNIALIIDLLFTLLVGICALRPRMVLIGGDKLSYIGKISYGIYLFHTIVFYGIRKFISADPAVVFLMGTPLTIGIASFSYEFFESYFLKLKKKFIYE